MSTAVIQNLLDTRLQTISGLPTLELENTTIDVTSNKTAWVRSTLLPAESTLVTVGSTAIREFQGYYQVDCFYPTGNGSNAAHVLADTVVSTFPIGLTLNNGAVTVYIQMASATVGYKVTKYYCVPVRIQWSCYL